MATDDAGAETIDTMPVRMPTGAVVWVPVASAADALLAFVRQRHPRETLAAIGALTLAGVAIFDLLQPPAPKPKRRRRKGRRTA